MGKLNACTTLISSSVHTRASWRRVKTKWQVEKSGSPLEIGGIAYIIYNDR